MTPGFEPGETDPPDSAGFDCAGLIARCLAAEPGAIAAFVQRYERLVYRICWRMLGHHQDAEDVSQDVFVRAIQALPSFDTSRRLEPWLLTIAVNRCRTVLSRHRTRPQIADVPVDAVWFLPDNPSGDLAEELHMALQTLRDDHRLVFVLFHDQQLNLVEISQLTGHPVGTIKTWLYRARRILANHLLSRGIQPAQSHELR